MKNAIWISIAQLGQSCRTRSLQVRMEKLTEFQRMAVALFSDYRMRITKEMHQVKDECNESYLISMVSPGEWNLMMRNSLKCNQIEQSWMITAGDEKILNSEIQSIILFIRFDSILCNEMLHCGFLWIERTKILQLCFHSSPVDFSVMRNKTTTQFEIRKEKRRTVARIERISSI